MRTARILAEGIGYYHIILKTTGPHFLFQKNSDKLAFLDLLERTTRFTGIQPLSFALLDNHMHLFLKVPLRESVPYVEFRLRIESLYGTLRTEKMFARWEKLEKQKRSKEALREKDRLLSRMYDLGEFMKTLKECFQRYYTSSHDWEGTIWKGRYKSILVGKSYRAFKALSLYVAMNPVRAGVVKRGIDSRWTSYGLSKQKGSFGWRCHQALLREMARLAGNPGGTDSIEKLYDAYIVKAEAVSREVIRQKLADGGSLSLYELIMCQVHAFSNGKAFGTRKDMESVPLQKKRITGMERSTCELCNATRLRGTLYRLAEAL